MEKNEYQIGDVIEGTVCGIQSYGAFIAFNNGQQGLIHISEISAKFVRSITDYLQIDKLIRVKVIGVDPKTNYLRLSLKQLDDRERQVVRKPPSLKPRRAIMEKNDGFQPLADQLDNWIDEAWQKQQKENEK